MAAGCEELLASLLAVPLDRFVEERNRLAREARAGGDRDTSDLSDAEQHARTAADQGLRA